MAASTTNPITINDSLLDTGNVGLDAKPSAKRKFSAEHRANISLALKGRKLSAKHKAKMSLALKGRKLSAKHKAKISLAQKGRKLSAEHKGNISLSKAHTGFVCQCPPLVDGTIKWWARGPRPQAAYLGRHKSRESALLMLDWYAANHSEEFWPKPKRQKCY